MSGIVLILGSGPSVVQCRGWPRAPFAQIVAINNAWQVRPDWDFLVYPEDFPKDRRPGECASTQRFIEADTFVPAQNRFGGFVFAGATMAFTAAYWALEALQPQVLAFLGCDMVYAAQGSTHFYGAGTADPLRADPSLRDLGAKSARLALCALAQGCACVNLSQEPQSALLFPRVPVSALTQPGRIGALDRAAYQTVRDEEAALGYATPSGFYDGAPGALDLSALDQLDGRWRALYAQTCPDEGL